MSKKEYAIINNQVILNPNTNNERNLTEEFAERYLEKDNDCTKYYKGFGLIE